MSEQPSAGWLIRKEDGGIYGPFPEPAVVEWAQHGKLEPSEEVAPPGGRWRLAGNHELFGPFFPGQREMMDTGSQDSISFKFEGARTRSALPLREVGIAAGVLLLLAAMAWSVISNRIEANRAAEQAAADAAAWAAAEAVVELTEAQKGAEIVAGLSVAEAGGNGSTTKLLTPWNVPADLAAVRRQREAAARAEPPDRLAIAALAEIYAILGNGERPIEGLSEQATLLLAYSDSLEGDPEVEYDKLRGLVLLHQGNRRGGEALVLPWLQGRRDDPEVLLLRGLLSEGDTADVMDVRRKAWDRAVVLDPASDGLFYGLARHEEAARNYGRAIQRLERSLELAQERPGAWALLGSLYLHIGDVDQALVAYNRAVRTDPRDPAAVLPLAALAYQRNSDPSRAVSLLGGLLAVETLGAAEARIAGTHRSAALRVAGDLTAAVEAAEAVLEANPGDSPASFHKGLALRALGRGEEAIPLLEAAAEAAKEARGEGTCWYELGQTFASEQRNREATESFDKATEAAPGLIPAYFGTASVRLGEGDVVAAANAVVAHLGADPLDYQLVRDPWLYFSQAPDLTPLAARLEEAAAGADDPAMLKTAAGIVRVHSGELEAAAGLLAAAFEEGGRRESTLFYSGLVATQRGLYVDGEAHFSLLVSRFKKGVYFAYHGENLLGLGRAADAVTAYEQALSSGTASTRAMGKLADALQASRARERARVMLEEALAFDSSAVALRQQLFRLKSEED